MSKSMVWAHFEPTENGAECNVVFCRRPFVRNSTNSTKAYWSHLKYHHPKLYKALRATVSEETRQRREDRPHLCAKCQLHGVNVPVKNHSRVCPYLDCDCVKCDRLRQQRIDDSRRRLLARRQRRVCRSDEDSTSERTTASPGSVASCSTASGSSSVFSLSSGSSPPLTPPATVSPSGFRVLSETDDRTEFPPMIGSNGSVIALLSLRFVPPEVGMDFDLLAMAMLWNGIRRNGSPV